LELGATRASLVDCHLLTCQSRAFERTTECQRQQTCRKIQTHASVSLQLSTGTCTSDIPLTVCNAENYQPLVNSICTKNQWTLSQIDRINWKALQLALKRNNKKRIHYTKLVHNTMLPTNKVVHHHNPAAQKCPTCANCPHEDRYHIMQCGAQSRDNWRAETITVLEHWCKQLNTEPGLALVLVTGISQWLNGQDTMSPEDFPPKYNQLVSQQNDIGWRQLFNGRMSTEWARIQDDYIYIYHCGDQMNYGTHQCSSNDSNHASGMARIGQAKLSLFFCGNNGTKCGSNATQPYMVTIEPPEPSNNRERMHTDYNQFIRIDI
jgi:hypothetical protein